MSFLLIYCIIGTFFFLVSVAHRIGHCGTYELGSVLTLSILICACWLPIVLFWGSVGLIGTIDDL